MDTTRHVVGILLVVLFPPALIYWLVIHPFTTSWRKLGAAKTYLIVFPAMVVLDVLLYLIRGRLMGLDLGTNWVLVGVGLCLYGVAILISIRCRRQLSVRILVGVPEVSDESSPGKLLQDGIYGVVRHPRYLSVVVGTLGMALVINYVGVYAITLLLYALLYVIIRLEERELLARFGQEYAEYQSRVPRLIPRIRRKSADA
ncbi:MAG: isoprenylcysteine carboxylmethyltransferase family protein [Phycisphaerae bacterium]|nr:isoprenylcysteine carboxylmethyltransferase family protein [Phycisphaerae bacterium]